MSVKLWRYIPKFKKVLWLLRGTTMVYAWTNYFYTVEQLLILRVCFEYYLHADDTQIYISSTVDYKRNKRMTDS